VAVLAHSVAEDRLLLTQDYDFGYLGFRRRLPAIGIVIIARASFSGTLDEVAAQVFERLNQVSDKLEGNLTILEPSRLRQRKLGFEHQPKDANG
jgi:hypothetical protein